MNLRTIQLLNAASINAAKQGHSPCHLAVLLRAIAIAFSVLVVAVGGCQRQSEVADAPPVDAGESSFPDPPASEEAQPQRTPLPDDVQIYQDDNAMFALALPAGYEFEAIASGMEFVSGDGGFGGTISYQTYEGNDPLERSQLEAQLKERLQGQFADVVWQSEALPQPDGSLRVDWSGTNAAGDALDGLSFIEQHGNTLFILTAHGINQPYTDYNDDARIIVGTYVVQENPDRNASATESTTDTAAEPTPSE